MQWPWCDWCDCCFFFGAWAAIKTNRRQCGSSFLCSYPYPPSHTLLPPLPHPRYPAIPSFVVRKLAVSAGYLISLRAVGGSGAAAERQGRQTDSRTATPGELEALAATEAAVDWSYATVEGKHPLRLLSKITSRKTVSTEGRLREVGREGRDEERERVGMERNEGRTKV